MYPVNFTEKMSVNLMHAHTVCTRSSLSKREEPGDEASGVSAMLSTPEGLVPRLHHNHVAADSSNTFTKGHTPF